MVVVIWKTRGWVDERVRRYLDIQVKPFALLEYALDLSQNIEILIVQSITIQEWV